MNTGPDYDPQAISGDELSYLDPQYEQAKAQDPSEYEKLPDGDYTCRIDEVLFRRSKNGDPMVSWFLTVIGSGRKTSKNQVIKDSTLGMVKSDFTLMGLNGHPLSSVGKLLPALKGRVVDIRIKTNVGKDGKEYSNTYIQRAAGAAPTAKPAEEEDSSIPF